MINKKFPSVQAIDMALVFGIGVGLFILIILWALVILAGLLTLQWNNGGAITAGLTSLAIIITIVLALIPRGKLLVMVVI